MSSPAMTGAAVFSPLDPTWIDDPHAGYSRLRERAPAHFDDRLDAWVLTRHADCAEVLADPRVFTKDFRTIGEPIPDDVLTIQMIDGAQHEQLRHAVLAHLRSHRPDLVTADRARDLVDELVQRVPRDEDVDLVEAVIRPFALALVGEIVGLDDAGLATVRDVSRAVVLGMDAGLDPDRAAPSRAASAVLTEVVATARSQAADGLAARVDALVGEGLPEPLVGNSVRAMLHAGYESLSRFLGLCCAALLEHLDAEGRRGLDLTRPAVFEELARWCGPVQADSRVCTADTTLESGARLRAGDVVVTVFAAANRDPAAFPDPGVLHFGRRNPRRSLAFGDGAHACLGRSIARVATPIVLQRLLQHPGHELTSRGTPTFEPTATLRGLSALPVRFATRDRRAPMHGEVNP